MKTKVKTVTTTVTLAEDKFAVLKNEADRRGLPTPTFFRSILSEAASDMQK